MENPVEVQEVINPDTDEPRYIWAVRGRLGGVHVWAQRASQSTERITGRRYYGGIEIHCAAPGEYDDPAQPSHRDCWLIGAPCWHVGSSLQFDEQIAPMLERVGPENTGPYCLSVAHSWYHYLKADE